MKKINITTTVLTCLLCSSLAMAQSTPVPAAPTSSATTPACTLPNPQNFVQGAVDQVLGVLQQYPGASLATIVNNLTPILGKLIFTPTVAAYVVPPSVLNAASSSDQAAFYSAFNTYAIILYASALQNYNSSTYSINVYPLRGPVNNTVQINTAIINNNNNAGTVLVSFILKQSSNGCNWGFVDLSVNNAVSLATTVQQQNQSILQNMKNPTLAALTAYYVQHNQNSLANGNT